MLVVTGAAGFVGRHVLEQAAATGLDTVTIDRRRTVAGRVDLLVDLADPGVARSDVADVLSSASAVIHLAGAGGVRSDERDIASRRHRDNVLAASTVLAMTPLSIPVVVASSSSVYGGCHTGRANHEDDRLRPLGGYARSKFVVEQECWRRVAAGGPTTIVRPFTVIGAGQRPDMAMARWVAQALAGQPLTVIGGPDRSRDLTDAGDVARALLRLAELAPRAVVNLGSGTAVSLGQMIAAVSRRFGHRSVHAVRPVPDEPDHTLADVARCHDLLGFVPRSPNLDAAVGAIAAELTAVAVGPCTSVAAVA